MGKQRRKNNDNAKNKKTAIAMSDPDCIVNLPTDDSDTPEVSSRSRWYFQPYGKDLSCTSDYMPPVMAGVTQQWSVDIKHLNRGLYWPVLGISFNKVDLKSLSSIVFHVHVDNPKFLIVPQPYKEVITKQQLKEMYCEKGIVRWKLHRQFDSSNYNGTMPLLLVDMEICLDGDSSEQHFPKLHYFELQSCSIENFMKGTPLRAHKPYLWSIDVEHREADTDPGPALPAKIMHSAISGNGERAATLSTTNRHVYLDLWDLSSVNNSLLTANEAECWNTGNHSPSWCTGEQFSFLDSSITESQIQPLESGAVSISWSGIFVAVFRTIQDGQTKELIVFKYSAPCSHDMSMDQRGKSSGFSTLQRCNNLFDFHGEGTFHISDTNCPQEENELFIACDGTSVRIYEVHRGWSHVCTVPLSVSASFFIGEPTIALQGKFFAWFRNKGQVFIWDIEESALAAVVNVLDMEGACLAFSSDASMIAVSQGGTITNYWTGSGTAIGKFVSGPKIRTIGLTFIHNGSQILVNCSNARDSVQEISGYILDATSMTQLDTFFNPGQYFRKGKDRCKDIGSQELYVSHGSTLDKIRLEDYLCLTSPTSPADLPSSTSPPGPIICRCNCKDGDTSGFYELSDNVTSTSSSGLLFSYTFNIPPDDAAVKTHTFTLTISQYGSQRELITIPPFALTKYTGYYKSAHFLDGLPQLLLYSDEIVIVLELPETFLGDCKILQVYWLQDKPYWDVDNNALQLYERLGLLSCKHQKQLLLWLYHYNIDDEPIQVQVPLDRPHDCDYGFEFASAVVGLVEMYKNSNDTCKRAIFHYLEAHINRYPNPSNLLDCVLGKVLEAWPTARKTCEDLLVSLLSPESTRWIPRPDYCQGSNPLWVTLEMSRKDPLAMNLFKTFMQYCLRRAHEEEDHFFITPLVACLPELCDEERPHQEIALDILQRMAYIPVKKSSYVVDNHIIAHPPEMKMLFKKDSERLLYKCNNPILQLHLSSEPRNVQNDNFIDGIFKASFDMLWVDKDLARSKNSRSFESSSWLVKTGLYTLVSIAWYSFNPCSRVSVVPHTAHSEFFDNPALAALIEYKWNTIGFKLWLTRFIVQSIYYILVLTASLVQVYRSYDTLFHVYIAIATFSGIFLWLEFVQLLERPWVYISIWTPNDSEH
ncbi:hypothetical protein BCR41DRAFT_240245 [Lobosporangium transversale]|uniref:Uncharacterized protein n=1 Tax=Lobosporangium transversale TaxID=64571 RepID=A0A1Y2G6V4_9FUNG|nr:hypothetical protein BCR41DRAFT_240245 [Lobosporangium transversale]ORY95197.1 hypothetical protein BCR41DRAFT_240245 [Lobosporangium transversale]|eukprot:XP_021875397.1 hypothetical protein BCR41DRAFT_240245 [Lobosporangium transversale]